MLVLTTVWTKLFGFFGSILIFYICFGLMLVSGELTTDIKRDDDSQKTVAVSAWAYSAIGSCIYVLAIVVILFIR